MDLFTPIKEKNEWSKAPLAARMRPERLEDIVGQQSIIGPGKLLNRAIRTNQLGSLIFHGPPGTGKTTLAYVIAKTTGAHFIKLNAVTSGVSEVRQVMKDAEEKLKYSQQTALLFIDEIHRFNKAQQDALLPAVEEGKIILIGATTGNPFFSINSALISRSRLFRLEPLSDEDILTILRKALLDKEKGLGNYRVEIKNEALLHFARKAAGDARLALNGLELAVLSTIPTEEGIRNIDLATAEESIQEQAVVYDKNADQHYDAISAFIKSIRASESETALYYLARMLYAGEDPNFIMRRLLIFAAEDVGLSDPQAIVVVQSVAAALERVGLPEGRIIMAEAVLYLVHAPKSKAVLLSIEKALEDVKTGSKKP